MGGPAGSTGPSDPATGMPFIVLSNGEKADSATRKLIRSHARRGKTQKGAHPDKGQRTTRKGTGARRAREERTQLDEVIGLYTSLVPRRVGSDLSFLRLADDMEPSMLLNMIKVSPAATRVIFPLKVMIGFEADKSGWLYPIARDPVALHITAFAMECFVDRVLHRRDGVVNPAAMLHFERGMRLLRERLLWGDDEVRASNATMSVVLKLASAAQLDGDYRTSRHHMEGLRRMVNMRGGLGAFAGTELLVEILRCDLAIAILGGPAPVFFLQPSEPMVEFPINVFPASGGKLGSQDNNTEPIRSLEPYLATCWLVMKRFCSLVNLGTQTQGFIHLETIHQTMAAVLYRLLRMSFAAGSMDETVRQGLIAFSYHVFLQWRDVKPPYTHFRTTYKDCILNLEPVDGGSPQLILWLLMTGATSFFDVSDEGWLKDIMRRSVDRCGARTWREVQDILKSFMWISLLDEVPGKQIYDSLRPDKGGYQG